jgi:hypothetical protein
MAAPKLSIDATYTMNSGFEIPVLGYGVSLLYPISFFGMSIIAGLSADLAITLHTGGPMQIVRQPVHVLPDELRHWAARFCRKRPCLLAWG